MILLNPHIKLGSASKVDEVALSPVAFLKVPRKELLIAFVGTWYTSAREESSL